MIATFVNLARSTRGVLACALVLSMSSCAGGEEQPEQLAPDKGVQTHIARAVNTFNNGTLTPAERFAAIGDLAVATKDDERFFRQLFYYYRHAENDKDRMTAILLVRYLDISKLAIVGSVMPYIDSEDPGLRSAARIFLEIVEGEAWKGCPDGYRYFAYVLGPGVRDNQRDLVKYLYDNHPGCGLLAILEDQPSGSEQSRSVRWAEHVISTAIWEKENGFKHAFRQTTRQAVEQLELLSRRDAWWVRLYVAEILHRHPEFRTPEVMTRLKNDQDKLIRQAVTRIEEESREPNRPVEDGQPPVRPADPDGDSQ